MAEVSRIDRTRTFLKAVISFNNGAAKIDCVVKNFSASGARLDVTSAIGLPSEFDLYIPHRSESRRAQLVWRDGDVIGVRFRAGAAETAAAAGGTQSGLEAENARLRVRVRELTRRLEELGQDPDSDASY